MLGINVSDNPRIAAYAAIDSERDYQDAKWGNKPSGGMHEVNGYLVFMQSYLTEAMNICTRNADPEASSMALHNVRKIAALAVACMEQHGAPKR